VSNGIFVACGGCGYAAKSSDEIGRIAAHLAFSGEWVSNIPKEAMEPKFRPKAGDYEGDEEQRRRRKEKKESKKKKEKRKE